MKIVLCLSFECARILNQFLLTKGHIGFRGSFTRNSLPMTKVCSLFRQLSVRERKIEKHVKKIVYEREFRQVHRIGQKWCQ